MPDFPNFYENIAEAQLRLRGTIVVYDDEPYYVGAITDHRGDGVFRVYLEPIGRDPDTARLYPPAVDTFAPQSEQLGATLDQWLETETGKKSGYLRKKMNSPLFKKFRPFPLGMCNIGTNCYYVERQPTRRTEQGLTRQMLLSQVLSTTFSERNRPKTSGGYDIDLFSPAFKAMVKGDYPTAEECLFNLSDPAVENEAAGFHRNFALVRGPLEMIFLAYKGDVVGVLQKGNFDYLRIGRQFGHCKEVIEALGLFGNITQG